MYCAISNLQKEEEVISVAEIFLNKVTPGNTVDEWCQAIGQKIKPFLKNNVYEIEKC